MNGEYIMDSYLNWFFEDEYILGDDGIFYLKDTKENENESEVDNEL